MTGQQLKNSILQMAVQGKLVPQDPNDEPASVLLERIRKEKEQLIKESKIKKDKNPSYIFRGADNLPYEKVGKNEPVCIADEVPFDIPDSWEWVRLSTVNDIYTGNSINESEKKLKYTGLKDGYYYIGTKDVGFDHIIDYDNGVKIPYGLERFRIAPRSSILMCVEGGSAGRKISFTNQDVCFGNKLCCFVSLGIEHLFLYYYLQSPLFQSIFKENTTGIIGGVSVNTLKSLLFPIPPLEEQKRIVNKLKELESYLKAYADTEQAITNLNQSFPEQLKKSILQEAVQGKLVSQDPTDEPASVLLERIRAEKEQLIKAGKIKRDKHESVIFRRDNSHYEKLDGIERCIDDEIPFEIPENWCWVRLGVISTYAHTKKKLNAQLADKNIWSLDLEDIEKGGRIIKRITVGERKSNGEKTVFSTGDVLYSKLRPYLLKILVAPDDGICTSEIVPFSLYGDIDAEYIVTYLKSTYVDSLINSITYGIKMPRVGTNTMVSLLVPMPPFNEQQRIVRRIEELFPLIEEL